MRIGINLLYLLPGIVGGTETYASGLINNLACSDTQNEYIVFVNRESAEWPMPDAPNFIRVVCPVQATNRAQRYFFEQVRLPFLARLYKLQLLHSLGYVGPVILPCKSITSIHDIVYDYPGTRMRKELLRLLVGLSARSSDHILTLSTNSQRQIASRLHVSLEKITVVPLAAKKRPDSPNITWPEIKRRLGIEDEYLLAFSSLSPSKNIPRLLRAFAKFRETQQTRVKLVLVGHIPQAGTPLTKLAEELNLNNQVVFTGYLPDDELVLILRNATIFIFPSLYEGFGIPVLEAMAEGVPVVCSNAASLPEIAGNAALLFDPLSVDEIATSIQKLINSPDLRTDLISRGHQNMARFSWRKTADKTLQVYKSVIQPTPLTTSINGDS